MICQLRKPFGADRALCFEAEFEEGAPKRMRDRPPEVLFIL